MEHPNIDLVKGLYGAYLQGDLDAVTNALAPDVRWHNSGSDPTAGTLEGRDATLAYLFADNHLEDYALETTDMLVSDERIAIIARTSGRLGDRRIVNDFVQVMHIVDGRIVEVWNYMWDQKGLAEAYAAIAAVAAA